MALNGVLRRGCYGAWQGWDIWKWVAKRLGLIFSAFYFSLGGYLWEFGVRCCLHIADSTEHLTAIHTHKYSVCCLSSSNLFHRNESGTLQGSISGFASTVLPFLGCSCFSRSSRNPALLPHNRSNRCRLCQFAAIAVTQSLVRVRPVSFPRIACLPGIQHDTGSLPAVQAVFGGKGMTPGDVEAF